jgi:hypothetical protein
MPVFAINDRLESEVYFMPVTKGGWRDEPGGLAAGSKETATLPD